MFDMLRSETLHPDDLTDADIGAWRALCATRPEFQGPLLGPDFARAVGAVRPDARVGVWRQDEEPVGFLAYHQRPGGLARPIGAPLSDYHGVVAREGLDLRQGIADLGLSGFRFTGLIDPLRMAEPSISAEHEAFLIELTSSAEDYLEALRAASPKRFKNYRRLDNKLDREVGAITLRAPDHDPAALAQLLTWKREQLARTGVHDYLAPAWTQRLIEDLFARQDGPFQGLMINLYVGDQLVAGHFGVRLGDVYHPWIASTDPTLSAWSPGQLFLLRAIAAMPDLGLTTYDLGPGHEHYKRPYALSSRMIGEGMLVASGPRGRSVDASERVWALAEARSPHMVGRLRRRLDAIATTELSFAGRARGLAHAIATRTFRPGAASEAA